LLYATKGPMQESLERIPLGKAERRRQGCTATVVSYSFALHRTLEAAEKLAADGIELDVIDLRSLFPLDLETVLASVERTGRLAVVHEAVTRGGIGGDIVAQVCASTAFAKLKGPVLRIGARESPIPYSPPLESFVLPSTERIETELRTWLRA
ncbi:MAG: transketolase C-terminal domain-containing protein, partial [Polyangiaceae bacterium]